MATVTNKIIKDGKTINQPVTLLPNENELLSYSVGADKLFTIEKSGKDYKLKFTPFGKTQMNLPANITDITLDDRSVSLLPRKLDKKTTIGQEIELKVKINGQEGELKANAEAASLTMGTTVYSYTAQAGQALGVNISKDAIAMAFGKGKLFVNAPNAYNEDALLPLLRVIAPTMPNKDASIKLGNFTLHTLKSSDVPPNFILEAPTGGKAYAFSGTTFQPINEFVPLHDNGKPYFSIDGGFMKQRGLELPMNGTSFTSEALKVIDIISKSAKLINDAKADPAEENARQAAGKNFTVNTGTMFFESKDNRKLYDLTKDFGGTEYNISGQQQAANQLLLIIIEKIGGLDKLPEILQADLKKIYEELTKHTASLNKIVEFLEKLKGIENLAPDIKILLGKTDQIIEKLTEISSNTAKIETTNQKLTEIYEKIEAGQEINTEYFEQLIQEVLTIKENTTETNRQLRNLIFIEGHSLDKLTAINKNIEVLIKKSESQYNQIASKLVLIGSDIKGLRTDISTVNISIGDVKTEVIGVGNKVDFSNLKLRTGAYADIIDDKGIKNVPYAINRVNGLVDEWLKVSLTPVEMHDDLQKISATSKAIHDSIKVFEAIDKPSVQVQTDFQNNLETSIKEIEEHVENLINLNILNGDTNPLGCLLTAYSQAMRKYYNGLEKPKPYDLIDFDSCKLVSTDENNTDENLLVKGGDYIKSLLNNPTYANDSTISGHFNNILTSLDNINACLRQLEAKEGDPKEILARVMKNVDKVDKETQDLNNNTNLSAEEKANLTNFNKALKEKAKALTADYGKDKEDPEKPPEGLKGKEYNKQKNAELAAKAIFAVSALFLIAALFFPPLAIPLAGIALVGAATAVTMTAFSDKFKYTIYENANKELSEAEQQEAEDAAEVAKFMENEAEVERLEAIVNTQSGKVAEMFNDPNAPTKIITDLYNNYGVGFNPREDGDPTKIDQLCGIDGHDIRQGMYLGINSITKTPDTDAGRLERARLANQYIDEHFDPSMPKQDRDNLFAYLMDPNNNDDLTTLSSAMEVLDHEEAEYLAKLTTQKSTLGHMRGDLIARIVKNPDISQEKRLALLNRYGTTIYKHFALDDDVSQNKLNALFEGLSDDEKEACLNLMESIGDKLNTKIGKVEKLAEATIEKRKASASTKAYFGVLTNLSDPIEETSIESVEGNVANYLELQSYRTNQITLSTYDQKINNCRAEGVTAIDKLIDAVINPQTRQKGKLQPYSAITDTKQLYSDIFKEAATSGIMKEVAILYASGKATSALSPITKFPLTEDQKLLNLIIAVADADSKKETPNPAYNKLRTLIAPLLDKTMEKRLVQCDILAFEKQLNNMEPDFSSFKAAHSETITNQAAKIMKKNSGKYSSLATENHIKAALACEMYIDHQIKISSGGAKEKWQKIKKFYDMTLNGTLAKRQMLDMETEAMMDMEIHGKKVPIPTSIDDAVNEGVILLNDDIENYNKLDLLLAGIPESERESVKREIRVNAEAEHKKYINNEVKPYEDVFSKFQTAWTNALTGNTNDLEALLTPPEPPKATKKGKPAASAQNAYEKEKKVFYQDMAKLQALGIPVNDLLKAIAKYKADLVAAGSDTSKQIAAKEALNAVISGTETARIDEGGVVGIGERSLNARRNGFNVNEVIRNELKKKYGNTVIEKGLPNADKILLDTMIENLPQLITKFTADTNEQNIMLQSITSSIQKPGVNPDFVIMDILVAKYGNNAEEIVNTWLKDITQKAIQKIDDNINVKNGKELSCVSGDLGQAYTEELFDSLVTGEFSFDKVSDFQLTPQQEQDEKDMQNEIESIKNTRELLKKTLAEQPAQVVDALAELLLEPNKTTNPTVHAAWLKNKANINSLNFDFAKDFGLDDNLKNLLTEYVQLKDDLSTIDTDLEKAIKRKDEVEKAQANPGNKNAKWIATELKELNERIPKLKQAKADKEKALADKVNEIYPIAQKYQLGLKMCFDATGDALTYKLIAQERLQLLHRSRTDNDRATAESYAIADRFITDANIFIKKFLAMWALKIPESELKTYLAWIDTDRVEKSQLQKFANATGIIVTPQDIQRMRDLGIKPGDLTKKSKLEILEIVESTVDKKVDEFEETLQAGKDKRGQQKEGDLDNSKKKPKLKSFFSVIKDMFSNIKNQDAAKRAEKLHEDYTSGKLTYKEAVQKAREEAQHEDEAEV